MTDIYKDYPQTQYVPDNTDMEADDDTVQTGKQRVIRLVIIALIALMVVGLIVFVLIPYIAMLNQPIAPPLPPAIQT